jgi:hypothetical protein
MKLRNVIAISMVRAYSSAPAVARVDPALRMRDEEGTKLSMVTGLKTGGDGRVGMGFLLSQEGRCARAAPRLQNRK